MRKRLIVSLVWMVLSSMAHAATIVAASLSSADVQAAINLAAEGDTVQLPSGSATWTTGVTVVNKALTIVGAGITSTVLTHNIASAPLIYAYGLGTKAFDISNLTVIGSSLSNIGLISIGSVATINRGWKVHDILFTGLVRRGLYLTGQSEGVVYRCTFQDTEVVSSAQGITVFGDNVDLRNVNDTTSSWVRPPAFGTDKFVYVEDCVFNFNRNQDNGVELYNGGRIVLRYCTFKNTTFGVHGLDSGLSSGHSWEVYNNTFLSLWSGTGRTAIYHQIRGGTGVFFNNRYYKLYTGTAPTYEIALDTYRATGNEIYAGVVKSVSSLTRSGDTATLVTTTAHGCSAIGWTVVSGFDQVEYNGRVFPTIVNSTTITFRVLGSPTTPATGVGIITNDGVSTQQVNGAYNWDGNTAVTDGSGTHTGSTGVDVLTDGTKTWTTDYYATTLPCFLWNRTSGAGGYVRSNTTTTATATLVGGSRQTWSAGDSYVLTFGYPAKDMCGRTSPTVFYDTYSTQPLLPLYEFNNWYYNLSDPAVDVQFATGHIYLNVVLNNTLFVQENREFYNNTEKPSYTPYTYPHPLRNETNFMRVNNTATAGTLVFP